MRASGCRIAGVGWRGFGAGFTGICLKAADFMRKLRRQRPQQLYLLQGTPGALTLIADVGGSINGVPRVDSVTFIITYQSGTANFRKPPFDFQLLMPGRLVRRGNWNLRAQQTECSGKVASFTW